jgi:hypothetical protein
MNDKFRDSKIFLITAGIAAVAAGYFLAILALPILFPRLLTREMDRSSQDVARFLQKARSQSIERNAPVAFRVEKRGSRTVLWLDWNITGRKVLLKGDALELPRGLVVSQDGEAQTSGVIAVFNPRGGFRLGYNSSASSKPLVLSVSRPGRPIDGLREVSMTGTGDFLATNTQDSLNASNPAFAAASDSNGPPPQVTASLTGR